MLTLATAALGFSLSSSVPFVQAASRGASAIAMASQDELKKQAVSYTHLTLPTTPYV